MPTTRPLALDDAAGDRLPGDRVARSYLHVAGRWQDHLLHQLVEPG